VTQASPPRELLAFVRAALPPPPARVLEVGAGHGELAAALAAAGYEVVAVDPAGHVPEVHAVPLHEIDEPPASFAAAVAVLSLHHVEPLSESCRRLGELVRPGGTLVIDEFDMDRFDEVAAGRWLDQRGETGDPAAIVAAHDDLHPVRVIRTELSPWFEVGEPVPGPYLYRWDLPDGLRGAEEEQIARGALPATGARLIGRRRLEVPPLADR
jgi:SAM-dependent methyltransferase